MPKKAPQLSKYALLTISSETQNVCLGPLCNPSNFIGRILGQPVYMEHFEQTAIASAEHKPSLGLRYVDDVFSIWPHGDSELEKFLNHFSIQKTYPHRTVPSLHFQSPKSTKQAIVTSLQNRATLICSN